MAEDTKGAQIRPIPLKRRKTWGLGTMVVPVPSDVDEVIRAVPRRKLITVPQIGASLAKKHGTTIACPVTTAILAWMVSRTAHKEELAGRAKVTPYWRALKAQGELNPKYPGGIENLRKRLEAEGHVIEQKSGRFLVRDYEKRLVKI